MRKARRRLERVAFFLDAAAFVREFWQAKPVKTIARILGAVLLLGLAAFCLFGFMATYEYSDASRRLPWQVGYGVGALICVAGAVALLWRRAGD
jgi:hypothetical protein